MDHTGGYYMAMAIMLALIHRERTGEGQWVDLACTDSALTLHGPTLLDWTVNGRTTRQAVQPSSNRSPWLPMAPHGIYPCAGDDEWLAIACRSDAEWLALGQAANEPWCADPAWASMDARYADQDRLDEAVAAWTRRQDKFAAAAALLNAGVPAAAVQRPHERVDHDSSTAGFGLWPTVHHTKIGDIRVDGLPVHLSATDWRMSRGAPCLGEHNEEILGRLLGMPPEEVAQLRAEGVL
jgi:crotonobetainyl-CoA:carnitine CoA-transferase CaiB-like acyl-CoA transferase